MSLQTTFRLWQCKHILLSYFSITKFLIAFGLDLVLSCLFTISPTMWQKVVGKTLYKLLSHN